MKYTEHTFKELAPEETVRRAQNILAGLGIEIEEKWHDSGIENCWSMHLYAKGAYPLFSNGKGITRELARASAYGEFMEALQTNMFLYKFQSIARDPGMSPSALRPTARTRRNLPWSGKTICEKIEPQGSQTFGALRRCIIVCASLTIPL